MTPLLCELNLLGGPCGAGWVGGNKESDMQLNRLYSMFFWSCALSLLHSPKMVAVQEVQILARADGKDTVRNCLVSKGPLLLIASVYRCPAKFRSIAHCTKSLAKESCEPLVMADWARLVVDGSGLSLRVVKPGRGNSHVRIHHYNNSLSSRAGSPARPGRPLRHDFIFCFVSFFWTGSRWRH